jgi:hypothetical protein
MKMKLPTKKFMLGVLSIMLAIALMAGVVPALAAGSDPVTPIPGLGRVPNNTLIDMHEKLGRWYTDQDALLREADGLEKTFAALIASEAKQGKVVTSLSDALAIFDAEIVACRAIHLTAGNSVFAITGFKVNGDVRDRLAAGQQLLDGHAGLKDAHFRLTLAMDDLQKSFVKWRQGRISGIPLPPTATPKK